MDYTKYKHKLPYVRRSKDQEAYEAYRDESFTLHQQFKQDLFNELGIEDNPKRERLFDIAWDGGHNSGYSEVVSIAMEFVDLIN